MGKNIREIITLSVGHCSNFVVSHWLNLQEASFVYDESVKSDLNPDALFREGRLPNNQQCYVPRLLIIDTKNSLGSLACRGSLYDPIPDPSSCDSLWSGKSAVHYQLKHEKNEFQKALEEEDLLYSNYANGNSHNECSSHQKKLVATKTFDLRNKVNVWSDFLRPHLHPNAIYIFKDVYHQDLYSEVNKKLEKRENELDFVPKGWSFNDGVNVISSEKVEDEVTDRVRLLSEACDSLQGFHLLSDCHDGMGGVSSHLAEYLADDFGNKDLFSFLSTPSFFRPKSALQFDILLSNVIQSYNKMVEFSSLVVPLSLESNFGFYSSSIVKWPLVSYQHESLYESTAILGSFLDTISIPWRRKSDTIPMCYVSSLLTPLNRKIAGATFSFPLLDLGGELCFEDWLKQSVVSLRDSLQLQSVSGFSDDCSLTKVAELSALRGISDSRTRKSSANLEASSSVYRNYIQNKDPHFIHRIVSSVEDPLQTSCPFPPIFSRCVNANFESDHENQILKSGKTSLGNFYQGESVNSHLRNLNARIASIDVSKLPSVSIGDLDKMSWENAMEEFSSFVDRYGEKRIDLDDSD